MNTVHWLVSDSWHWKHADYDDVFFSFSFFFSISSFILSLQAMVCFEWMTRIKVNGHGTKLM